MASSGRKLLHILQATELLSSQNISSAEVENSWFGVTFNGYVEEDKKETH